MQIYIKKLLEHRKTFVHKIKQFNHNKQVQLLQIEKIKILINDQKRKIKKYNRILEDLGFDDEIDDPRLSSQNPFNINDNI